MKTQGRKHARTLAGAALLACGLLGSGAHALELGDAAVRSTLGERLLVDIPIRDAALAAPGCFSARLTGVREALGMRKTGDRLTLSTPRIISEPLLELTVIVSCPNIARLQRSYTLFIDPATMSAASQAYLRPATGNDRRRLAVRQPSQRPPVRTLPAKAGQPYVVQVGDTVSEIAQSLAPEGASIWPVVERIVADNPQAFIDGDADRLIAGATLALSGSVAIVTNTRTPPPTPPAEPSPTPPAPAATQALKQDAIEDAGARPEPRVTRAPSQADQLLGLLQSQRPDASELDAETQAPASPFKAQPATPVTAEPPPATVLEANSEAPLGWLTRLVALAGGMLLTVLVWLGWQVGAGAAARRRRERAFPAPLPSAVNDDLIRNGGTTRSSPALVESTDVIPVAHREADDGYEVAFVEDDDDDTFSFHNPAAVPAAGDESPTAEMAKRPSQQEDNFEVATLESIGMTTIMRGLDAETQKLLEQDYESELTHTQRLRKDIAERALARTAGAAGYDDTEEMPLISDTALMTAVDEIEDDTHSMENAIEASFLETSVDSNDAAPTSLDLDIDDPSVSVVLRESADLLAEALNEFDDEDDDESLVERQA